MAELVVEKRWVGVDLGGDRSTTVLQNGELKYVFSSAQISPHLREDSPPS